MSSLKDNESKDLNCLSPRAKPDAEIDHMLNVESMWRTSTLKSLIQGYSTQVITQCNAGCEPRGQVRIRVKKEYRVYTPG